jgi:hypothetical protein
MRTGWQIANQKILYLIPARIVANRMRGIYRYIDRMFRAQPRIRRRSNRNIDRRSWKPWTLARSATRRNWMCRISRRWPDPWRRSPGCNRMSGLSRPRPDFGRRSTGGNRVRWITRARPDPRRLLGRIIDRRRRCRTPGHWTSSNPSVGVSHCADDSNRNCSHCIIVSFYCFQVLVQQLWTYQLFRLASRTEPIHCESLLIGCSRCSNLNLIS